MHVILTMAVCMYAAVNMLGAAQSWHSSPTTALCFSAAAGALMLAVMESDRWPLVAGVALASTASLGYGARVLGRIRPRHHVVRAAIGICLLVASLVLW